MNHQTALKEGQRLIAARRFEDALAAFDRALAAPDAQDADMAILLNERGALLSDMGRPAEAVASYDRAIVLAPESPDLHYNRGNALRALGQGAAAVESYDRAIALAPGMIQAWHNRGSALYELARYLEAVASFDAVLRLQPGIAQAWSSRGTALHQLGRRDEALQNYQWAITLEPNFAVAWSNRGLALSEVGRPAEALAALDRALQLDPRMADAWYNRGNVLREQNRHGAAVQSYDHALALNPALDRAWINRSVSLRGLGHISEALESYGRALAINPNDALTLASRGIVLWAEKYDYEGAARDLARAVELNPDTPYALGNLLLIRQYGADWRSFDADVARLEAGIRSGKKVIEPFVHQAVCSSPEELKASARIYAADRYPVQPPLPARPRAKGKIRIGYVSGEFREQATAYLMAGVYECHDRSRFEITAFDNGGGDGSPMRARLEAAFDHVMDIAALSDFEVARKIQDAGIDILVNLNGYFGKGRMGVFAHRPAPIQVNYLGFPATFGAPYIDYIIADRIVIPDGERRFYDEKVVWLPHSYQANDSKRALPQDIPDRAACGLPQTGFVFCNFNLGYKLTPASFASWRHILGRVPGSVLWLLEGVPQFADNLRRTAEAGGIDGARLIFAPMEKLERHLARLTHADLFLDSLPYNAHTTASDALWAGVPLVTRRGTAFPGRVAASLLFATGLDELVTQSEEDYENLAVSLAQDAARLGNLRRKLEMGRRSVPLFDTARFTRHLEAAYETMLAQPQPKSFAVPAA